MPKIAYRPIRFKPETLACIQIVDTIVEEFAAQGFKMSLRQIYYQLVARDLFPDDRRWALVGSKWVRDPNGSKNAEPNYKWLGDVVTDGRLAGMIDWSAIEDRNRELVCRSHWYCPAAIVETCSRAYNRDLWVNQPYRPEVWIEKAALAGVFENVCTSNDVPYFACRGYGSASALWEAGQRLLGYIRSDQRVIILHFGDHDPSGLDMTRDIKKRLEDFLAYHIADDQGYDPEDKEQREYGMDYVRDRLEVRRVALTRSQIEQFNPPPDPIKQTDARWKRYVQQTGFNQSWELDALDPNTLVGLVTDSLDGIRDTKCWKAVIKKERSERKQLSVVADQWDRVIQLLK